MILRSCGYIVVLRIPLRNSSWVIFLSIRNNYGLAISNLFGGACFPKVLGKPWNDTFLVFFVNLIVNWSFDNSGFITILAILRSLFCFINFCYKYFFFSVIYVFILLSLFTFSFVSSIWFWTRLWPFNSGSYYLGFRVLYHFFVFNHFCFFLTRLWLFFFDFDYFGFLGRLFFLNNNLRLFFFSSFSIY